MRTITFAIALCLLAARASADDTVGRWCYQVIKSPPLFGEVIIVKLSGRDAELRRRFSDGSAGVAKLIVVGDRYYVDGSTTGDYYVVVAGTGVLSFYDDQGYIGGAKPMPSVPSPGDCLPIGE